MRNKKAWLRIVEAFLAILLIAGVIIVILVGRFGANINREESIYNLQKTILDEVANDKELRISVLNGETDIVIAFIRNRAPEIFNFTINICELETVCPLPPEYSYKKNIYANEVIISSSLQEYNPKKLKLFMWEKSED